MRYQRVMTALGLWVWAMWPKQLPFKEYNDYVYILPKWKYIYCLTLDKWWQFETFPTMQCLYVVLSGHTSMSYMPEHPMNLFLFCPKLYLLIVCSCTNEGHLAFSRHLRNIKWPTHLFLKTHYSKNICTTSYVSITNYHMVLVIKHARLRRVD